ncbi:MULTISPECIES: hypothetical protein [unclassified Microbacterium]|uniref:hypothetical protein n=1 Tax=unclassified Microbacterium TaxID=2609290 RepID=UPI000EA84AAD|nr:MULTISPECIES: hypothetical protein [unclassified Microbacterium]MBT2483927.1 hypothetical protein [Microbacterium sp. ISL-108]RKN66898.1 hypothetical protein D7252_04365 [Microbacterium sp. CGR2]
MSFDDDAGMTQTQAFATALRDAINSKRVTLSWLRRRLEERGNRVSMATLSYWRSGARRPEGVQSLSAVASIEEIVGLDDGALTTLLRTSNRTGPLGPNLFPIDEREIERAVRDAYASLDSPYPDTTREVTTHSVTDVGRDGSVSSSITRSVLQATVGTITATPFLEISPGVRTPAPTLEAVSGGRIAARYSHPGGQVHGVLFELEAPLTAPATAMIEWSAQYPADYPPTRDTGHAVSRQCRELLIWTRFHPDALPDWCEERVETPSGITVTPLSLNGGTSVHRLHRAFGPGAVQVFWGYGPRDGGDQPG